VTLTVAGILLVCGSPQQYLPGAKIVCTRFTGLQADKDIYDTKECIGPANLQIDSALGFVLDNTRLSLKTVTEHQSQSFPAFSKLALFEVLVNAVVHRDYSLTGAPIQLRMFDDRLELMVPGTLLYPVTVDALGKTPVLSNRNFNICRFLSTLRSSKLPERAYCEQRGLGVMMAVQETNNLQQATDQARGSSLFPDSPNLAYSLPDQYHLKVTLRAQGSPHTTPTTSPHTSPSEDEKITEKGGLLDLSDNMPAKAYEVAAAIEGAGS
jgi:hypothetical protein